MVWCCCTVLSGDSEVGERGRDEHFCQVVGELAASNCGSGTYKTLYVIVILSVVGEVGVGDGKGGGDSKDGSKVAAEGAT
jgi:hypothetical protein